MKVEIGDWILTSVGWRVLTEDGFLTPEEARERHRQRVLAMAGCE